MVPPSCSTRWSQPGQGGAWLSGLRVQQAEGLSAARRFMLQCEPLVAERGWGGGLCVLLLPGDNAPPSPLRFPPKIHASFISSLSFIFLYFMPAPVALACYVDANWGVCGRQVVGPPSRCYRITSAVSCTLGCLRGVSTGRVWWRAGSEAARVGLLITALLYGPSAAHPHRCMQCARLQQHSTCSTDWPHGR